MTKQSSTILVFTAGAALVLAGIIVAQTAAPAHWPFAGQDLPDSRNQPAETQINTGNASNLAVKWTFTTGGDVSATPTVEGNSVFVPDWKGNLFAIRKDTGELIWSRPISSYDGVSSAIARVSPAVHGTDIILGDTEDSRALHNGANVMAIDQATGALRWITQVESHPAAQITAPAVVAGDTVFVGVSSNEEGLAKDPSYPCCTFRGSMVALNANTGKIIWKNYMVPDNHGSPDEYSGVAIWQPVAVDLTRGSIFVGTGNNYSVPASVDGCQAQLAATPNPTTRCTSTDDYFDSALALDIQTGRIKWAQPLQGFDVWTVACQSQPPTNNCPSPSSPDYDLGGAGPNLLPNIVGFGQKSGIYWALNPDTGNIVWGRMVGPGGTLGGIEWGTATDGKRIYVAIGNNAHKPYTLAPNGPSITWGSWSALDAATGGLIWQTADPTSGATDPGAVSVANGVVYAGSFSGFMYGMDAATGKIVWSFNSGGSVISGPSIVDGTVFWGSGYAHIAPGIANNKVFAFAGKQ